MKKIPVILVTGFLGSGKTSLVRNLLNQFGKEFKIGVIQNEFAPSDIDGKILKTENPDLQILEINNGSVFCACLLGSFTESLANFAKTVNPDVILIEASGLSDPVGIAQIMEDKNLVQILFLSSVWCVIDSTRFGNFHSLISRVEHQVRIADQILINKTDLAEPSEIESIQFKIKELNPSAQIHNTKFSRMNLPELIPAFAPLSQAFQLNYKNLESCGRPAIDVFVFRKAGKFSKENLLEKLGQTTGELIRAKGFFGLDHHNSIFLEFSGKTFHSTSYPKPVLSSEFIIMGYNLDKKQINNLLKESIIHE